MLAARACPICSPLPPSTGGEGLRQKARLDDQRPGTDQVREAAALLGGQERMDLLEGLENGGAEAFRALQTQVAALGSLGTVEAFTRQSVRERGHGTAAIDFGLSALGLQVIEDLGQLGDLAVVEVELVGQETQRPTDAETAAAETFLRTFVGTAAGARPHAVTAANGERMPGALPGPLKWVHDLPPSRGAVRARGDCVGGLRASP